MFEGYKLRPKARNDLENIWLFTAREWSPDQADRYTDQIIDDIEAAAEGRRQLRPIPKIEGEYLKLTTGSHFVIVRIEDHSLIVVRVLHGRQDITRQIGE